MVEQFYLTYRTITGTSIPGQSEPVSNDNEGHFSFPKALGIVLHHQIEISVVEVPVV